MMMVPYMFNDDLMDDLFNDNWERDFDRAMHSMQPHHMFGKRSANVMKTDVRETEGTYELDIDLPGFKKEEVKLQLKDGCLTISAEKSLDKDETDKRGKLIRQERYSGACSRSFYVGETVEPSQISAKFENGILQISIPKEEQKKLPKQASIDIE